MARKHIFLLSAHKNITVQLLKWILWIDYFNKSFKNTQGLMNALLNNLTESIRVATESTSIQVKYFQKVSFFHNNVYITIYT